MQRKWTVLGSSLFRGIHKHRSGFNANNVQKIISCEGKHGPQLQSQKGLCRFNSSVLRTVLPLQARNNHSDVTRASDLSPYYAQFGEAQPPPGEWAEMRADFVSRGRAANEAEFALKLFEYCALAKKFDVAKSLTDFLFETDFAFSVRVLVGYLQVCDECLEEDARAEDELLRAYDKIKELNMGSGSVDFNASEQLLVGLSKTSRWKDGAMEIMCLPFSPSATAFSITIGAAFRNNEPEIGWSLVDKMLKDDKIPLKSVFLEWMQLCWKEKRKNPMNANAMVVRLLQFCRDQRLSVPDDVADSFRAWFKLLNHHGEWKGKFATISRKGFCHNCESRLDRLDISQEHFEKLRSRFSVRGLRISSDDLGSFFKYLETTSPYDIVVDGLNVTLMDSLGSDSPARKLCKVIEHLVEVKQKKVLVLGKQYMQKWTNEMEYISGKAHVYLADNRAKDDKLLLYAAMHSGLGTLVLSNDKMNVHTFPLNDVELATTFRCWQKSHQVQILGLTSTDLINFQAPLQYDARVQSAKGSWHIPCTTASEPEFLDDGLPSRWMCLNNNFHHVQKRKIRQQTMVTIKKLY